jgi:transposase
MGNTFAAIAKAEGVHPRTVQHWCAQEGKIGEEAVIKWGRRGVTIGDGRVLIPKQEREIVGHITTQLPGPPFRLWCVDALLELIRERFKMDISRGSVGNYLARWGIKPQIPEVSTQSEAPIRRIRERAQKEKALIFWAGEMTPPFRSEPAGKLTDGDILMRYARIGKGEIHFMFETDELRESGRKWSRFVEELGIIASERRSPRKAFVLVTSPKWSNKELLALHDLKYRRRPQPFEIFYV